MSNTRALVSCTILSLQDSCFVYPCCKCCLSRIIRERKRATCGRCGFTCDIQNVEYRYRLAFKVSRNQDIFGVTVFGGSLNAFFGITAGDLQKFIDLEKTNGTHTVQQLLVKAVENCFIGRSVIFGLKVPHNNAKTPSLSGQSVACQIISPCESLIGCTVIVYLKNLLQANSPSCCLKSVKKVCLSQQKDSQSSQRDELNSFDYTPPSCAKLDSQPSGERFTISSPWQSPGFYFSPEELSDDLLKHSKDCELNSLSPEIEETRTSECRCHSSQPKHVKCLQDETQSTHRKSFSSSCDMFESSAHLNSFTACDSINPLSTFSCKKYDEKTTSRHCVRAMEESMEEYGASFHEKSLYSYSGNNRSFDLEDAPLSESLQHFVTFETQMSEKTDTKEHASGKKNQIREQNRCSVVKKSVVAKTPPMCNLNNMNKKQNNENDCRENLEMNNAENPKTPTVLCAISSSGLKKRKPFSPTNNRLSFSNKKELALKRKKITSRPSVAFCSLNHEKGKYFRHCAQSEVHSVNCKVKQELIVFDDHGDKYNCSVDLFASGQSGMDMNLSDVTEISKVNEPRIVNTLEPGVSGPLLFSPCLQSTPVSFQHSCGLKNRQRRTRVSSLCSRGIKCEFKSKIKDLSLSDKRQKFDQLPAAGSTESFSCDDDMKDAICNSSVNEWSRDLFENSV